MLKAPKVRTIVLVSVLLIGTIAALFALDRYQYRIKAVVWHMRHGDFVLVAGLRVPVPRDWWAEQSSANNAHLWNSRTGESILLAEALNSRNFSLQQWTEVMEKRMTTPSFPIIARRDVHVAGGDLVCIERDYNIDLPVKPTTKKIHLPSVNCMSDRRVEITFVGRMSATTRYDYTEFYSLVSSIQNADK